MSCFIITENVMAFAWEPTGNKFAFIHGESPRISVSFYNIKPQGKVEQISKFCILKYFLPQNKGDTVK